MVDSIPQKCIVSRSDATQYMQRRESPIWCHISFFLVDYRLLSSFKNFDSNEIQTNKKRSGKLKGGRVKMPRRKKFLTPEQFQQKEDAKKSQTEVETIRKKFATLATDLNYSSVTKAGLETTQTLDVVEHRESINEIVRDPVLINEMLRSIGFGDWTYKFGELPYVLEALQPTSTDYMMLQNLTKQIEITGIEKIYNPYLYLQFCLREMQYHDKNRQGKRITMFHGTKKRNVDGICSTNFNWRLSGSSTGNRFGKGVSFTPYSCYAKHYSDTTSLDDKVMLVAEVFVGKSCLGDETTSFPPGENDTTKNQKQSVFVKYDDNTFYPAYLIHYKE